MATLTFLGLQPLQVEIRIASEDEVRLDVTLLPLRKEPPPPRFFPQGSNGSPVRISFELPLQERYNLLCKVAGPRGSRMRLSVSLTQGGVTTEAAVWKQVLQKGALKRTFTLSSLDQSGLPGGAGTQAPAAPQTSLIDKYKGLEGRTRFPLEKPEFYSYIYKPRDDGQHLTIPPDSQPSTAGSTNDPPTRITTAVSGEYTVWFGTNRAPHLKGTQVVGFSNERDPDASKSYLGTCRVWIPESHQVGSVGSSFLRRLLTGKDDRLKLRKLELLSTEAYWQEMRTALEAVAEEAHRNAVLFIHGYNVSFEEAALRSAQIGFDLNVTGVMAFYSWPSQGTVPGYIADSAAVEASTPHIVAFIRDLAAKSGATRLHVIAHSMGNRGLLRALERLARATDQASPVRLNQIILAAPDVDVDTFRELADVYRRLATRTTLYISTTDKALQLSHRLHRFPRVGLMPPLCRVAGIDTVNVTNVDLSLLGHGYVAQARDVLQDMHRLLRHDIEPDQRFGLRAMFDEQGKYWVVKA
jgi:esterase/lipase superfamily enzyme